MVGYCVEFVDGSEVLEVGLVWVFGGWLKLSDGREVVDFRSGPTSALAGETWSGSTPTRSVRLMIDDGGLLT